MQFMSLVSKLNSSPLSVVSTKSLIKITFPRSLSSQILFIQPKRSLTYLHISFKSIQWPYSLNFVNSFFNITTTPLDSGLSVCAVYILLNKDDTSYINVIDLTGTGILAGIS